MPYGKRISKWISTLAAIALLSLVLPADAAAQGRFSFSGQGGLGVGVSDLADLTDVGPSFGGGIAYWLTPRVAVRGDFNANLLTGKDAEGTGAARPDIDLFHYNGGLQFELTDPQASPWNFTANLGAGATTLDSDEFQVEGDPVEFSETYFALNGGLGIGYDVSRRVATFIDGRWQLTFTDEDDTAVFNAVSSEVDPEGFSTASVIPVTLGLRVRTN